jgi:hypothetical protein
MLEPINLLMLQDTKDVSFIPYRNGVVKITKDKIDIVPYIDVDGYIWDRQIIDRDYTLMKLQLSILLSSIQKSSLQLLAVVSAFFLPIIGILFLIGFSILVDTITGIWKAKKLGIPITSRKLSAIISKLMLYEVAVILFYLIDRFILNDIILVFFSIPLMLTKILALVLVSIETLSISENIKAVKGIDLWQAMKLLFARARDIKQDIDTIK